jgi:hypothetical protein
VSVAFDALDKIVNPVNLKTHSHEELVCRTPAEIEEFNRIVGEDLESRPECLRSWYMSCIREKQHQISSGGSKFGEFDVEDLLERVRSAESVTYFGGASLILLQRFLDSSVAGKIHCCIQAVRLTILQFIFCVDIADKSCSQAAIDSKQSLFRNQFNLHLCMNAAKAVLPNHASFASFKVVPSDASNLVQYCYHDLATSGASGLPDATLTRQILTYNIRKDNALAIAKGEALLSRTVTGKMPDLTAFLCGFYPRFPGLRFVGHEVVIDDDDGLTFRKSMDNSGIPVAVIDNMVTLGRKEISSILSDLSLKECK